MHSPDLNLAYDMGAKEERKRIIDRLKTMIPEAVESQEDDITASVLYHAVEKIKAMPLQFPPTIKTNG